MGTLVAVHGDWAGSLVGAQLWKWMALQGHHAEHSRHSKGGRPGQPASHPRSRQLDAAEEVIDSSAIMTINQSCFMWLMIALYPASRKCMAGVHQTQRILTV